MLYCKLSQTWKKLLSENHLLLIISKKTIMKKMCLFFLTGFVFVSCNNKADEPKEAMKDSTSAEPAAVIMNYPYTIEHPDYWEMGSTSNTMTALTALKAYEDGNIEKCVKHFGDSVHLQFDGLDTEVTNDSLKAIFIKQRAGIKNLQIKMDDWESVVSKDKNAEYVSLWYKEIWEDAKGKKDSLEQMDDIRMKNGKIIGVNEKSRKYPTGKS